MKEENCPLKEIREFALHENEIHFLFNCKTYADIRKKYMPDFYLTMPVELAFKSLLSSSNEQNVKNLSLFVKHAYKLRNELLKG